MIFWVYTWILLIFTQEECNVEQQNQACTNLTSIESRIQGIIHLDI